MTYCKNRRATRPLNSNAVKAANKVQPRADTFQDKKKWMNAYIAAGGGWECADPANEKPGQIVADCITIKKDEKVTPVLILDGKKYDIKIRLVGLYPKKDKPSEFTEKGYGNEFHKGELSDSKQVEGRLSDQGFVEHKALPFGMCTVCFYKFYDSIMEYMDIKLNEK